MRFESWPAFQTEVPAAELRLIERSGAIVEVLAPRHWTSARVEAWLDWADTLPGDYPDRDWPTALSPETPFDPMLGEGPERHARRLAAWGLALGRFHSEDHAVRFAQELTTLMVGGWVAPGPSLAHGVRIHPADPAGWPPTRFRSVDELVDDAADAPAALQEVADAIIRCSGDRAACADIAGNQALARAAAAARTVGFNDADIADVIALAATGGIGDPSRPRDGEEIVIADRDDLAAKTPAAVYAAFAAWRHGGLTVVSSLDDAEALDLARIAPRAAINVLAFQQDADLKAAARTLAVALDIECAAGFSATSRAAHARRRHRPRLVVLAGVAERLVAEGLAFDSDAGRARAANLYGLVRESAPVGIVEDAEMALRLGGPTLGAAPWRGPRELAESADGEMVAVLSAPSLLALSRLGIDPDLARAHLLGRLTLDGAPAIGHADLTARGFTDYEIGAVEGALAAAPGLRAAFAPAVVGAGFVCDVLGASEEALTDPAFDTLALAGFTPDEIAQAEAFALGIGNLDSAAFLPPEARAVFAGAAETPIEARAAMLEAMQPFVTGPALLSIDLGFASAPDEAVAAQALAASAGARAMQIRRAGPPASFRLNIPALGAGDGRTSAESAQERVQEKIVERIIERVVEVGRSRRKLPDRRKGYIQKASVGGHKVYLHTGEYEEGELGEIFIDMHKEGAAFRSLMNNFAIAISIGLQYGVPLDEFVEAFVLTRFDPAGPVTGNDSIRSATSILDYVFRELGVSYLGRNDLANIDPDEFHADGLGRGQAEEPQPISRFISKGFSRGATPDNLVFLPVPSRPANGTIAADVCPACGDVALVRKGQSRICQTCGVREGRAGDGEG